MDLRCQYASTHCPNLRSLKISGELHRFCLFHRRCANAAQRRWKQKKLAAATTSKDDVSTKPLLTKPRRRLHSETTDAASKHGSPVKRRRQSRLIAAPRVPQALQQFRTSAIPALPVAPVDFSLDDPCLLLDNDDGSLLDELIASVDDCDPLETAVSVAQADIWWWSDTMYFQQDAGVIV